MLSQLARVQMAVLDDINVNHELAVFIDVILCRYILGTSKNQKERSGSVVECLTRDRGGAGSSLTGVTALWSLSKTHLS